MSDGIQIERSKHAQEFVIIGNAQARDSRLSFRARGLHHHLLSLPPGWRVTTAQLAEDHPEGRGAIRAALAELVNLHYVTRAKHQDARGRWSTTMTVHDKPQVSAGDTEDRFPVVGGPVVGGPVVGGPDVGEPVPVLKTEPKTVKEDEEKSRAARVSAPRREAMVSRQAHASGASVRVFTDKQIIEDTRFAIAAIYGEHENKTISDEEVLALFRMKAPASKPVTSIVAYMSHIFESTPAFDTLLSQVDTELWDGGDDYDQAHDVQDNRPAPVPPVESWNQDILKAVINDLKFFTGREVGDEWAARVAHQILSRAPKDKRIPHPVAYVRSAVHMEPDKSVFLPTYTPSAA